MYIGYNYIGYNYKMNVVEQVLTWMCAHIWLDKIKSVSFPIVCAIAYITHTLSDGFAYVKLNIHQFLSAPIW